MTRQSERILLTHTRWGLSQKLPSPQNEVAADVQVTQASQEKMGLDRIKRGGEIHKKYTDISFSWII